LFLASQVEEKTCDEAKRKPDTALAEADQLLDNDILIRYQHFGVLDSRRETSR
jgi:hypothetical protein